MTTRLTEKNARSGEQIRLEAEKAAFEGKTFPTVLNSLQARTLLSPETRLFAEVCYEKKLIHYVTTALIECARSEEGRTKAYEISKSAAQNDLQRTWKPVVACCAKQLRFLKLEATNSRLSRLSEHWEERKVEEQLQLSRWMKDLVQCAVSGDIVKSNRHRDSILDWIELLSLPQPQNHEVELTYEISLRDLVKHKQKQLTNQTTNKRKNHDSETLTKHFVIVNALESFTAAEELLRREVVNYVRIDVIFGNEEDGARFYRSIFSKFTDCGIQLIWRGRRYGHQESPKIVIGSREYFTLRKRARRNRVATLAVILHAESNIGEANCFIAESLNHYLAYIFALTEITMKHVDEMNDIICKTSHPTINHLLNLVKSWPSENQIIDSNKLNSIWNTCYSKHENSWNITKFLEDVRANAICLLEDSIRKYKVALDLCEYVDQHCSQFIQNAINARAAVQGQDYVVYSQRTSRSLTLKVRLKTQLDANVGMLQFLELRHGCAITPYRVPRGGTTSTELFQQYDNVIIIQRNNCYRYCPGFIYSREQNWNRVELLNSNDKPLLFHKSAEEFLSFVETSVKNLRGYQIIVVCPTIELLNAAVCRLEDNENVFINETPLGIRTELIDESSETLVICTTLAFFEGWKYLNRVRSNLRIIVCHEKLDNYALEVACDLVNASEIDDIILQQDAKATIQQHHTDSWFKSRINEIRSVRILSEGYFEPEDLIRRFKEDGRVQDLIEAKRLMHKRLAHISSLSKIMKILASDTMIKLKEVEAILSIHGRRYFFERTSNQRRKLHEIANKHHVRLEELETFVRDISQRSVDWKAVRAGVASRFELHHDAEHHWQRCFGHLRPMIDRRLIALSSECVQNATDFLPYLRQATWPEKYRKSILQCSDRPLDDCALYYPESGLDEKNLLKLEGASIEFTVHSTNDQPIQLSHTTPLNSLAAETLNKKCPLCLLPRRCYDRLAKDLFDGGVLICRDYEAAAQQMHPHDRIQLPIILETKLRSPLERTLAMESALMEFGSQEWMEWLERKLRHTDFHEEVVRFYHRRMAERDYCVQDEKLIQRLREALTHTNLRKPTTDVDQRRVDAFVYSTMDILQRGERLVTISPPFSSLEALSQLSNFIRARRMPPPEF